MQVGTGVGTASITDNFTAGTLNNTGRNGDLAIQGSGFFVVSDSVTGSQFATRDGAFSMDANGYIVNTSGLRLQGFSDSALTTRGDIRVTVPGGTPAGVTVNGFSFNDAGIVTGKLSDGTTFTAGQVLLQRFQSPQSLVKEGGNLYSGFAAAGALAQTEVPSASGSGLLKVNSLELSNVELTSEFATLITSQRGFQASARIITTSDEVLQEVVNLKR